MRILINAASANMGGATTYLMNVVRCLAIHNPNNEYIVIAPRSSLDAIDVHAHNNVTTRPYPYENTGGILRLWFDQVVIGYLTWRLRVDILFSTTGFGTWICSCPQVLLIRNTAYFDTIFHSKYRELGRSLRNITIRRWLSVASMKRSEAVIFPTEAMKHMVEEQTRLNKSLRIALHYGFDNNTFLSEPAQRPEWQDKIVRMIDDGYRIILNVSTYAIQKNLETVVSSLPLLAANGHRFVLITTTSRSQTTDKAEYDALKNRATELGVANVWIELGYVDHENLSKLYNLADIFVFPSFTESFGHPMVEAMASGLPIVAAGTAVNREVCGEAGVYFDTFNPADCARRVEDVLSKHDLQRRLSYASLNRMKLFSWSKYSKQLHKVFDTLSQPQNR